MSESFELALSDKLRGIHSALDDALGDSDIEHMDDEELRDAHPIQWAAARLSDLTDETERLATERAELALHLNAMIELHGKPKRDEWLSDKAWEHAIIITENAKAALDRLTRHNI